MKHCILNRWLLTVAMLSMSAFVHAAQSDAVRSPRAEVRLVSAQDAAAPAATLGLALHFRLQPGWHIYWMNPGDAGQAPRIEVFAPEGARVGDVRWPAPERHVDGPVTTYIHQGDVLLPFELVLPSAMQRGAELAVKASWLVCKDICIPEEGAFRLALPPGNDRPGSDAPMFAATEAAAPVALDSRWQASVDARGVLILEGPGAGALQSAEFFAADWGRIDHAAPQTLTTSGDIARVTLAPGAEFDAARALEGVLRIRDADGVERALWVSTPGERTVRAPAVSLALAGTEPPVTGAMAPPAAAAGEGPWWPLLLAFAGGVLLNLMPCVFPVLAIKALSFARVGASERTVVRRQSIAYCIGVVASFVVLAAVLLALRSAGSELGWGFQFQSPVFVSAMAVLLFAVGLNLSGVFQFGSRLASAGSTLTERGGLSGSFFTGVLAVVVATPCTAPFMGGAIAAALAAPALHTLAIFTALGVGMALPYLLLAFMPGLARRMPRPGLWMERLKQALAFPMYGAAAWLVWVLSQQSGADGVLHGMVALLLVAFAAWLTGVAQGAADHAGLWRAGALVVLVAGGVAIARTPGEVIGPQVVADNAFTPQRLAELRASGTPVFVNMTAAWCVTCLMNEKVALSTDAVQAAFAARGVIYLKGDWTRADPDITRFLQAHGRDGVPLYVYFPSGGAPVVLPQILTPRVVIDHIAS
ncbi:protein-disulfide reductase DsbD family protein [Methyloversatilis thermotolerans]|uniref:protein-disulfide reductase DsbD family protein n=1 Tax=Methyloversatilis thermotolerans TaxID=1346290 RepID=UPI00058F229B|nr:protein-disulfide reductase DsbD domain-containing protein [Methyloversatilis thermotolerans]